MVLNIFVMNPRADFKSYLFCIEHKIMKLILLEKSFVGSCDFILLCVFVIYSNFFFSVHQPKNPAGGWKDGPQAANGSLCSLTQIYHRCATTSLPAVQVHAVY
jgi:hypothetical protein